MIRWEYRVERYAETGRGWEWMGSALKDQSFEDGLDAVGDDGWELVASTCESNEQGRTISTEYVFKRPKPS